MLLPRHLGRLRGRRRGPTLLVVAGVHGNEPAGVEGLQRFLRKLDGGGGIRAGEVVGLTGNRTALERGVRYVDTDLNRIWHADAGLTPTETAMDSVEARERRELASALRAATRRARGAVYVLDLHTTSSDGGAFAPTSSNPTSRRFAESLQVPVVLGMAERLGGTLLDEVERQGWIGAVLEAGRHDDPASVERSEAAIWGTAQRLGMFGRWGAWRRQIRWARRELARAAQGLPHTVEVRHRQAVPHAGALRLQPGLRNFRPVRAGERLGEVQGEPLHAQEDGLLLMPLYQAVGTDGFFLVRSIAPAWTGPLTRVVRRDRGGG